MSALPLRALSVLALSAALSARAAQSVPVTITNTTPVPVTVTNTAPVTVAPIPASPFFGRIDGDGTSKAIGAVAGVIGVSSIIVNNATSQTQTITFFDAFATDASLCLNGTGVAIGGAQPFMYFTLEPLKTTQFTFPTPLVFNGVNGNGITCIASNAPAGVQVFVSGVSQ